MPETTEAPIARFPKTTHVSTKPYPDGVRKDFVFFSRDVIKAYTRKEADGSDGYYIEGPCSSTVQDLMGDIISAEAQKKMEQAVKGMTLFLNHEYDIPENIFGTCVESELKAATDPEQGPCFDLVIRVRCHVTTADPQDRVYMTWLAIKNGVKLGFSIGGYVPNDGYEWKETPDGDFIFIIHDIELLEVSVVGIPANQRAIIDEVVEGREKGKAHVPGLRKRHEGFVLTKRLADAGFKLALSGAEELPKSMAANAFPFTLIKTEGWEAAATEELLKGNGRHVTLRLEQGDEGVKVFLDTDDDTDGATGDLPAAATKKLKRGIAHITKAMDHGVCGDASSSLHAAHKCLMSLMPEGQGEPEEDAQLQDAARVALEKIQGETAAAQTKLDELTAICDSKKSEADALEAQLAKKHDEVTALVAKVSEIAKMRPGRKSGFTGAGSAAAPADPARRRSPLTDSVTNLGDAMANGGGGSEGRSRSS